MKFKFTSYGRNNSGVSNPSTSLVSRFYELYSGGIFGKVLRLSRSNDPEKKNIVWKSEVVNYFSKKVLL